MTQPKNEYYVIVFGRDPDFKETEFRKVVLEGDFHVFETKKKLDRALTKMQVTRHEHEILNGQQFVQLPDGRAAVIVKGLRFAIPEVN